LEQAAVDAAKDVRQAAAGGRRARLGELQRKADRLYAQALRARLRADAAVVGFGEDTSAARSQRGVDGPAIPVITWNRPELDWTSLVAAAIDETDDTSGQGGEQTTSAAADFEPNGSRVGRRRSSSPPPTR
jgi:hypothetical protein